MKNCKPIVVAALTGCVCLAISASTAHAQNRAPNRSPVAVAFVAEDAAPAPSSPEKPASSNKSESSDKPATPNSEPIPPAEPGPLSTIPFTAAEAGELRRNWAKSLGREMIEKISLGLELVLIPPGKYRLGSPRSERGHEDDEDQVDVTLTEAVLAQER